MGHIVHMTVLLSVTTVLLLALPMAHAVSPYSQFESGIPLEEVQCMDEKVLLESPRGTPACVREPSVEKMIRRGFVQVLQTTDNGDAVDGEPVQSDPTKISELIFVNGPSITMMTDKQLYDVGELVKIRIINTGTTTLQFQSTAFGLWISDINNTGIYYPNGAPVEVQLHPRQHVDAIWNQYHFYLHDSVAEGIYKIHVTGFPDKSTNITIAEIDDLPNTASVGQAINGSEQLDSQILQTSHAINRFAVDFYKHVSDVNENVFFSPFSMYVTLSALYGGLGHDASEQLFPVPTFGQDITESLTSVERLIPHMRHDDSNVVLEITRRLWIVDELESYKAYVKSVEGSYLLHNKSTSSLGDKVDRWIVDEAGYKESDIADHVEGSLYVTDLAYFSGVWLTPLPALDYPLQYPFWIDMDESIDTVFLVAYSIFDYTESNGTKILKIPYDGNHLSMLIILPDERDGLELLEKSLTVEMIEGWQNDLHPENVFIEIPMLTPIEGSYDFSDFVHYLGIQDTLDFGIANFPNSTNLGSDKNLHLSKIFHKTLLDTPQEIVTTSIPPLKPDTVFIQFVPDRGFIADHPFMFVIQNDVTRTILFMGKFIAPL